MLNLEEVFEKFSETDYIEFERIENPLHHRPDMCAFLLLDRLVSEEDDVVTRAEHDEIYLSVDCEKLAKVATEADILMLVRCGVRYNPFCNSLCMFV